MNNPALSLHLIDQLREEGMQAARHGLPFKANPHPYGSAEAREWDYGYLGGMRPEEEVE
ncbi:MAG: hypothetical protein AAFO57_00445 [Pseudomonadota bacterium]